METGDIGGGGALRRRWRHAGERAAVELLLAQGADPTLRNDLGESAEDRADRPAADPGLVPMLREAEARRTDT